MMTILLILSALSLLCFLAAAAFDARAHALTMTETLHPEWKSCEFRRTSVVTASYKYSYRSVDLHHAAEVAAMDGNQELRDVLRDVAYAVAVRERLEEVERRQKMIVRRVVRVRGLGVGV